MKFELIGGIGEDIPLVYITKGEFRRCYEKDKYKTFCQLNTLAEMYTAPQCFHQEISETCFNKLYEHMGKSKYKGFILDTNVEYDYSINKLGREIYSLKIALISKIK